jgi:hypothetical protein
MWSQGNESSEMLAYNNNYGMAVWILLGTAVIVRTIWCYTYLHYGGSSQMLEHSWKRQMMEPDQNLKSYIAGNSCLSTMPRQGCRQNVTQFYKVEYIIYNETHI